MNRYAHSVQIQNEKNIPSVLIPPLQNSSAKGAGMGPVRISIIVVRKITSVFINRHGAKCEPAYHPSWAAYKGHS